MLKSPPVRRWAFSFSLVLPLNWLSMAIPAVQAILLPLLRLIADRGPIAITQTIDPLATSFALTDEDLAERLSNGQTRFQNRVYWAIVNLKKTGLIDSSAQSMLAITDAGKSTLVQQSAGSIEHEAPSLTPNETIEQQMGLLNDSLRRELLDTILGMPPSFFEKLVLDLLCAMGYGGGRADSALLHGGPGDGGIDGIIKQDPLGLDNIYIQAKRWALHRTVGRPDVQAFAGSLLHHHATKGIFITTTSISNEACEYVTTIAPRIVLINGNTLADLMIRHNVGVIAEQTFVVKRLNSNYFALA